MLRICPVSTEKIDENIARTNALLVAITLFLAVLTPAKWLVGLLALDFFLRGFGPRQFSPYALASKRLVSGLELQPKPTNLAPKQLAARIGFLLSALAALFFLIAWPVTGASVTILILAFALLEGLAGICVACLLYPYLLHWQRAAASE